MASRYACGECARRADAPGDCPVEGSPLLDLEDEDVRLMLVEEDDRAATQHMQRQVFMCMPVGVAVPILIASFVPGGGLMVNFLPFGMGFILWAAGVTMALTTGLNRVRPFQRKFAELQTR